MLKLFGMGICKPVATPITYGEILCKEDGDGKENKTKFRIIVGSLMFLINTRPNIKYIILLMARLMNDPSIMDLKATKRIFRYVRHTTNFFIH